MLGECPWYPEGGCHGIPKTGFYNREKAVSEPTGCKPLSVGHVSARSSPTGTVPAPKKKCHGMGDAI